MAKERSPAKTYKRAQARYSDPGAHVAKIAAELDSEGAARIASQQRDYPKFGKYISSFSG